MQSGLSSISVLQQAKAVVLEADANDNKAVIDDIDLFITIFEVDELSTLNNTLSFESPNVIANRLRENLTNILLPVQAYRELRQLQESLPQVWRQVELQQLLEAALPSQHVKLSQIIERIPRGERLARLLRLLNSQPFEQLCQLQELHPFSYPSIQYNAIHNALVLLGQYFPFGLDDETNTLVCSITTEEIEEKQVRFVFASGHHTSINGTLQIVSRLLKLNPINREPIPERDWHRMQLLNLQETSSLETHSIDYAASGAIAVFLCVVMPTMGIGSLTLVAILLLTAVGIIHFPVFISVALSSHVLSLSLCAFEFVIPIIGALIGAVIGCIPRHSNTNFAAIEALKEKVGDILENSTLKKLKYRPKSADAKYVVGDHPEEKQMTSLENSNNLWRVEKKSQDDLILASSSSGISNLRKSHSCPNFFSKKQLPSEVSIDDFSRNGSNCISGPKVS